MEHKLDTKQYPNIDAFAEDVRLVFDNCILYNPTESIYSKNAIKLKNFFEEKLRGR